MFRQNNAPMLLRPSLERNNGHSDYVQFIYHKFSRASERERERNLLAGRSDGSSGLKEKKMENSVTRGEAGPVKRDVAKKLIPRLTVCELL